MQLDDLPVLALSDDARRFAQDIGESFQQFGFALVSDHGLDPALVAQGWELARRFFAQPDNDKMRWHDPHGAGARGYTPFGRETAKGATACDLKEFWHVGRELPQGSPPPHPSMPANAWPDVPTGFQATFSALFDAFDHIGTLILSRIALYLGLPADWFEPVVRDGNSILRLLHYPPVHDAPHGAIRAQAHEDINLITLLLGAEESGLELQTRAGTWHPVAPPPGALVVNIGDMLERLTNGVLPSTTHRVRNPDEQRTGHSRYSMPFFLHPHRDFLISTLPQCIAPGHPNQFPNPITADDFLQQRLHEIGLRRTAPLR